MTAIYNEVDVEFEGQVYHVKANFEFINRVEQRGINLIAFVSLAEQGVLPKTSDIAWIIYAGLTLSGADVKYNDVGEVVRQDVQKYMQAACDLTEAAYTKAGTDNQEAPEDSGEGGEEAKKNS